MEKKLIKNIKISGKIKCLTGLHIGGASDSSQIGGVDNPVITDPFSKLPYIPGSSLKGKIRSLLEIKYEKYSQDGKVHSCNNPYCFICNLFGRSAADVNQNSFSLSRLIVRDAFPTEETKKNWEQSEKILHGTEVKYENTINRLDSRANPRAMERVPKDSEFEFEMILSVYDNNDEELIKYLKEGMKLLEDNYLGGSGSRGSGKIKFDDITYKVKNAEDYENNNDWKSYP